MCLNFGVAVSTVNNSNIVAVFPSVVVARVMSDSTAELADGACISGVTGFVNNGTASA